MHAQPSNERGIAHVTDDTGCSTGLVYAPPTFGARALEVQMIVRDSKDAVRNLNVIKEMRILRQERQERDSRQTLAHLKSFCDEVSVGLDAMTFEERQQLLRLVIDRVTVDNGVAHIDTRIPGPSSQGQLRLRDPELVEG